MIFFIFAQNEVKVGCGGHCIEDVSFVWYEQLSVWRDDLSQREIQAIRVFEVMLFQCSLNDLCSLILTGQQNAFIHVPIVVTQVHADPDDAGVIHLAVIDGQRGHGHGALMTGQSGLRTSPSRFCARRAEVQLAVGGGAGRSRGVWGGSRRGGGQGGREAL